MVRHVIDEELKALLNDPVKLFLTNRDRMKQGFAWQGAMTHCLCALLCAQHARLLDTDRIHEMRRLVRERTGGFSLFRGIPLLPLATLLSGSLMPEDDLSRVLSLYDTLRAAGFAATPYLAETAFMPLLTQESFDAERCAHDARVMFKLQKKARPFLDAQTTCLYAMLCAASGGEPESIQAETERGYRLLKTVFPSVGTTYALARVLTLHGGDTEEKCTRAIRLYQDMRAYGLRYGRSYELPALGVLSLLPVDSSELISRVAEIEDRLKQEKGFTSWSLTKPQRVLYAACLYAITLTNEQQDSWLSQGLIQSVTGVLIAAQTAACASASAGAAAAAASN